MHKDPSDAFRFHFGLHVLAWLTAIATFGLIALGALVTSKGAGLAVPDWPNTFGQNMFLYPPSEWKGGVFYEHTHRLAGSLVGLLSILLTALAWKVARPSVRYLATGILVLVVIQGVMGGLRVTQLSLALAIVHGCVAQVFFCLTAAMVLITSRRWAQADDPSAAEQVGGSARALVALILAQLIVGAIMRHYAAGLAIPDFPLAYGKVLPPADQAALAAANAARDVNLGHVTLWQVWVHFIHRVGAVAVAVAVLVLFWRIRRQQVSQLMRPATLLLVLTVIQFTLGAMTVLWRRRPDITSTHVVVGALVLVTSFVIAVRASRRGLAHGLHRPANPTVGTAPMIGPQGA